MHRARLADEAGAEFIHHAVGLHQRLPEALRVVGIILRVGAVLLERNRVLDFARHGPDVHVDAEVGASAAMNSA